MEAFFVMNRKVIKECESSCEYILPDYMGDIRKVLSSKARAVPGGKFISEGAVEVSGVVEYEIIYADSENKLTAISASSDYEMKIPVDSERCEGASEESNVANLTIRITGPRKMIMKVVVSSDITLSESAVIGVSGDAFESGEDIEKATDIINIVYGRNGTSGEREYAEEAERIPGVRVEDVEILSVGGNVRVMETESVADGVRVKGELIIDAIIRTPEQPAVAIRRIIPFEETVSIDGASAGMQSTAGGYVASAVCGLNDEDGECVVAVNVIAEYYATVYANESAEIVTDAYLKTCDTENKYSNFEYGTFENACNVDLQVTAKLPKDSAGCADASEILIMNADLRSYTAEPCENGVNINGEMTISGVACENNVDGTKTYLPIKTQIPFSQNVNINCQFDENSMLDCKLYAVMCEGAFDAEELHIKVVLGGKMTIENRCEIMRLENCRKAGDASFKVTPSRITVYYPSTDDTLFSVAKKFHTTAEKIARDNGISESVMARGVQSSVSDMDRLIIR